MEKSLRNFITHHLNCIYFLTVWEKKMSSRRKLCSKKFILIAEYYNPTPVEVSYRGHNGKLFKRDFAGEMMKKYSDLKLIDYF